jgi:hypothetical protein
VTPEQTRALRARVRRLVELLRKWSEDLRRLEREIAEMKKRESEGEEWKNQ